MRASHLIFMLLLNILKPVSLYFLYVGSIQIKIIIYLYTERGMSVVISTEKFMAIIVPWRTFFRQNNRYLFR